MSKGPVIGLCAHVDAGKTTLSESMLFLSGALRRQGRVDHGDAFLDTDPMEKDRGITIFSKEARLTWNHTDLTFLDTPGHTDFSGEMERALGVLDAAVLVISATDGVQPHTRTLWRLLEQRKIPVILFLNKTDLPHDPAAAAASLQRELSDQIIGFPSPDPEKLALCDETCLDTWLREGETLWAEKAAEIRLYSGARYTSVQEVSAGQICCVVGLSKALPGDGLGSEPGRPEQMLRPCYACRLVTPPGADLHYVLNCLETLEEEEPLIQVEYEETRREIRVHSMGDVYLEVLRSQLADRFGLDVSFAESTVLYRETIEAPVEGAGHYEPLRHYAEVHLLISPLPRGSGLVCDSSLSTDDLSLNWQRLIVTHLREKVHIGVLTGSPVTDLHITLIAGKAHLKHTEGGDFRQATYRALRQGLMKARSILLEPWMILDITVPRDCIGRVLSDLSLMGGRFSAPEDTGAELCRLSAAVPASGCADYGRQLAVFTKGRGSLSAAFLDWEPCADQEKVIRERAYDPCRDVWNTPDSVFCSHGAGYTVPWNEADALMHLPFLKDPARRETPAPSAGGSSSGYRGTREEDLALEKIFERTYGPVKARQLTAAPTAAVQKQQDPVREPVPENEILLIDGYNVIHAWDEWKPFLPDRLGDARDALRELMCEYAGATGRSVILVFDAYAVPGNPGKAEKYKNIYVIYTREAQTADAFIEQSTYYGRNTARIRVVTSDRPEQLIASGNAALRTSAREFHAEVNRVRDGIAAFLARNNAVRPARTLEAAYKAAWRKEAQKKAGES